MKSFSTETPTVRIGDQVPRMTAYFEPVRKPLIQRLRERLCAWFGHSYDPVDVLVFCITSDAIAGPQPKIKCRSCGQEFVRK